MDNLIIIICFTFFLVLLIQFKDILFYKYEEFIIFQEKEEFDLLVGNISWKEENIFRRNKKTYEWQERVDTFYITNPLKGRAKLKRVSTWETTSFEVSKELEKMLKQKHP